MLDGFDNEIGILAKWYQYSKEVAIKAESIDPNRTSFLQPLHEQRYSFDHLMRAVVAEFCDDKDESIRKSINSAIAHLQRSYSDTVEWLFFSVYDEYTNQLSYYTPEQINLGFPEYYSSIKPEFERIRKQVDEFKINKSVEKNNMVFDEEAAASTATQFLSTDNVNKLLNFHDELVSHIPSLIEIKKKHKRSFVFLQIVLPILIAIVIFLVSKFIEIRFF